MRNRLFRMSVVVSVLLLPVFADAACLIRLDSGGRIWTPHCWEEGGEWKFYVGEGVAGVEKNMVKEVGKSPESQNTASLIVVPPPAPPPAEVTER